MKYRIPPRVRVVSTEQGDFLLAERPLRLLKLNRSLCELVRRAKEEAISPSSPAEAQVMETLVSRYFAERVIAGASAPAVPPFISIVIPVRDREDELRRCLASLSQLHYPQNKIEVIVVDDGSTDNSPEVARTFGALLLHSGGKGMGPAHARNTGARAANGEILAFIDSDCIASPSWLDELVGLFSDPSVAAAGGLVDGMYKSSALDRYEAVMSSLSLGNRERSGQSGNDTFYLPSCNLLVRTAAFREAGGFDAELHVGEDVDLTWRLRNAGHKIVYVPHGTVGHEHRNAFLPFMKRRFQYGTSEGKLQLLHPERHKRMIVPPVLAVALFLALFAAWNLNWPALLAALLLTAADALLARKRLGQWGMAIGWRTIMGARLRALGSLAYYLSFHLARYYMTPLLLASLFFHRFAIAVALCTVAVGVVDYVVRRPKLNFPQFFFYFFVEQLAYGAGVFWGCLRLKRFATYRMDFLRQFEPIV